MRLAPTNNLPLERIVPPEGLAITGYKLPAGTIVGTSAYIVHRDQGIYGSNADEFCAERWLDSDESVLKRMQNHFFAVGKHLLHPSACLELPQLGRAAELTPYVIVRARRARLQRPHTSDDDDGTLCRSCLPGVRR